jgi:hypothetical protein
LFQAERVDVDLVGEKVKLLFSQFADDGEDIICAGWYKHSITPSDVPDEAPNQRRNIHVTFLRPKVLPQTRITVETQESPRRHKHPQAILHRSVFQTIMPRYMTTNELSSSDDELQPRAGSSRLQQPRKKVRRNTIQRGILLSDFTVRRPANVDEGHYEAPEAQASNDE